MELYFSVQCPANRRTVRAGNMDLIASGRLAIGQVYTVSFRTGDSGGKNNMEDPQWEHG